MEQKKICVIVKDNFIYYNKQEKLIPDPDLTLTPHAPIVCLTCARGSDIAGGTAYMTFLCCPECMKALATAGIKKIVYKNDKVFAKKQEEKELQAVIDYYEIETVKNEDIGI